MPLGDFEPNCTRYSQSTFSSAVVSEASWQALLAALHPPAMGIE